MLSVAKAAFPAVETRLTTSESGECDVLRCVLLVRYSNDCCSGVNVAVLQRNHHLSLLSTLRVAHSIGHRKVSCPGRLMDVNQSLLPVLQWCWLVLAITYSASIIGLSRYNGR